MNAAPTRTLLRVPASALQAGDEIVEPGLIRRTLVDVRVHDGMTGDVIDVRMHDAKSWVVADYKSAVGYGSSTYSLSTPLAVLRTEEEAH